MHHGRKAMMKKVLIDISDVAYNQIKEGFDVNIPSDYVLDVINAVRRGILTTQGATNGDIIKALFPNAEINYGLNGIVGVKFIHMTVFDLDWWNAPYKTESEK